MDSKLILEAARGTLDGTLSFPEVVGKLLAAGVEYYHVDYVGLRKRFYSAEGEMMATSINYEGLPPVAPEFDAAALRANILDSQRHGQKYREFTRRAMAGGVQGYIAFLRGKRVTYWGRTGDQHTEWLGRQRILQFFGNGQIQREIGRQRAAQAVTQHGQLICAHGGSDGVNDWH
jgi:uncharacterized protein YbcV (DUF1398 family)